MYSLIYWNSGGGNMSIFEIALDMGLTDSKNIARQFRQVKGCTPIEYRNRYLAGK